MSTCSADATRAVVTLSVGARPFVQHTRPFMEAYAARIGAAFHFIDSMTDPALSTAPKGGNTRFLKLPLLSHFLGKYDRVLYVDDDTLIGPFTPDLFAAVPCEALGATIERHKPDGWHAMHWRSACSLYQVPACQPKAWRLFNSGVMVLSQQSHAPLLQRWPSEKLECRVLCDQLYLNALINRANATLLDLGAPFNYVGSELRRAVVTSAAMSSSSASEARRAALRSACILHLTRKVPKLYTADWAARRALGPPADVLACALNATRPHGRAAAAARRALLARLPSLTSAYDIGAELCRGEAEAGACKLHPSYARARH